MTPVHKIAPAMVIILLGAISTPVMAGLSNTAEGALIAAGFPAAAILLSVGKAPLAWLTGTVAFAAWTVYSNFRGSDI